MTAETGDLWVFGYGSLMWRPGFDFVERIPATLHGHHRALCVYSHVHRGTPERPGLVLGLDRGGACRGVAFRVAADRREASLAYLRSREQVTSVYVESRVAVRLADSRRVEAVTYTADRTHGQYAAKLARPDLLRLVRQGMGQSGPNDEYVRHTHAHLVELGVRDGTLSWLVAALDAEALAV
jgi:cation transport protein ChaC